MSVGVDFPPPIPKPLVDQSHQPLVPALVLPGPLLQADLAGHHREGLFLGHDIQALAAPAVVDFYLPALFDGIQTNLSNYSNMSLLTSGSAPSFMVTPAVVWGTYTRHIPSDTSLLLTRSWTWAVMSTSSALDLVETCNVCSTIPSPSIFVWK